MITVVQSGSRTDSLTNSCGRWRWLLVTALKKLPAISFFLRTIRHSATGNSRFRNPAISVVQPRWTSCDAPSPPSLRSDPCVPAVSVDHRWMSSWRLNKFYLLKRVWITATLCRVWIKPPNPQTEHSEARVVNGVSSRQLRVFSCMVDRFCGDIHWLPVESHIK